MHASAINRISRIRDSWVKVNWWFDTLQWNPTSRFACKLRMVYPYGGLLIHRWQRPEIGPPDGHQSPPHLQIRSHTNPNIPISDATCETLYSNLSLHIVLSQACLGNQSTLCPNNLQSHWVNKVDQRILAASEDTGSMKKHSPQSTHQSQCLEKVWRCWLPAKAGSLSYPQTTEILPHHSQPEGLNPSLARHVGVTSSSHGGSV
jgi:hypothetical protein